MPFLINTTTAWVIGVAGGYHLAFNLDQGVVGLWVALILSHLLSLLLLTVRLLLVTRPNSPLLCASSVHD
ncbi:multidrug efflux protein [compost metagenome]